ncbi:MAG: hypothetical protein JWO37_1785 [Acidimicrobiales bacterium]|jgi:ABC-type sugar transport system substrate-binding protein|nr:hypothetical protein [Acidimicrobiales bacterium]
MSGMAIAMLLGVALLASACSSSKKSQAAVQTTTQGSNDGVAKARAFVAAHSDNPTSIAVTDPVPAKPPTGKKIVYIQLPQTGSLDFGAGIKDAAAILGWTVEVVETQPTPEAVSNAMSIAVEKKPDAVISGAAFAVSTFAKQVAQLAAAGIPFVTANTQDPLGNGVTANIGSGADFTRRGQWMANWIVADSDGKADIAVFNLSTFPVLNLLVDGLKSTLTELCSSCKVAVNDVLASSISTTLPGEIVSYLRAHPSVTYVVTAFGDMTLGLPAALQAAGLTSKVKVVTQHASKANLKNIQDGTEAMNLPEQGIESGWMMVDAVVRAFAKAQIPEKQYETTTGNYVTKANVSTVSTDHYIAVTDYQAQFARLWLVK